MRSQIVGQRILARFLTQFRLVIFVSAIAWILLFPWAEVTELPRHLFSEPRSSIHEAGVFLFSYLQFAFFLAVFIDLVQLSTRILSSTGVAYGQDGLADGRTSPIISTLLRLGICIGVHVFFILLNPSTVSRVFGDRGFANNLSSALNERWYEFRDYLSEWQGNAHPPRLTRTRLVVFSDWDWSHQGSSTADRSRNLTEVQTLVNVDPQRLFSLYSLGLWSIVIDSGSIPKRFVAAAGGVVRPAMSRRAEGVDEEFKTEMNSSLGSLMFSGAPFVVGYLRVIDALWPFVDWAVEVPVFAGESLVTVDRLEKFLRHSTDDVDREIALSLASRKSSVEQVEDRSSQSAKSKVEHFSIVTDLMQSRVNHIRSSFRLGGMVVIPTEMNESNLMRFGKIFVTESDTVDENEETRKLFLLSTGETLIFNSRRRCHFVRVDGRLAESVLSLWCKRESFQDPWAVILVVPVTVPGELWRERNIPELFVGHSSRRREAISDGLSLTSRISIFLRELDVESYWVRGSATESFQSLERANSSEAVEEVMSILESLDHEELTKLFSDARLALGGLTY